MALISKANLLDRLKASLDVSVVKVGDDGDAWTPILLAAAERLGAVMRRRLRASITLTAGVDEYPAPVGFLGFEHSDWGLQEINALDPWDRPVSTCIPEISEIDADAEVTHLVFEPAPSAAQITVWGEQYQFTYRAAHKLTDSVSSIHDTHAGLFILLAQIEVMGFVARRNASKTVRMNDGLTGGTRNGTPAGLVAMLTEQLDHHLMSLRRAA